MILIEYQIYGKLVEGLLMYSKEGTYVASQQTPFNENVLNKTIFSQEVPDSLPGTLVPDANGQLVHS